jgi:TonB-dependent SusC/RagA subfamily outer membrane receptor
MKKVLKNMFFILAPIFFQSGLNAQLKTVTGKITTFRELPVQNASIAVTSNNQTVLSDSLGQFSVECSETDQLIISAEGFIKRKVKIKKETKYALVDLDLLRQDDAKDIAVGYGHVKDKDKLYAMSDKNESNFDFSKYSTIYEVLSVNFPGVQVYNNEIIIRSSASFTVNTSALLVVDGREVTKSYFGSIVPSDIAQINILKDASASVYGSRGANGVVLVETKRGKQ